MFKMNKRWFGTAAAAALAAALMIGGTFAYLTDKEEKTNEFTVGKVNIELEEPNYDQEAAQNIVPLQKVAKDPKVTVKSSVPTLVFLKLTVPKKNVTVLNEDGTLKETSNQDLYNFYHYEMEGDSSTAHGGFNNNWKKISTTDNESNGEYIFAYNYVMQKDSEGNEETSKLFDEIQLKNILNAENLTDINVKVDAYAIQASYLGEAGANMSAGDEVPSSSDILLEYYSIINNQATVAAETASTNTENNNDSNQGQSSELGEP